MNIHYGQYVFTENLPPEIKNDANRNFPCVILKFRNDNQIFTYVMKTCNSLNYFLAPNKLKNPKRCKICYEKTKHFRSCFRCNKKICSNCVKSLQNLKCPFCQYDILEHSIEMNKLYDMS